MHKLSWVDFILQDDNRNIQSHTCKRDFRMHEAFSHSLVPTLNQNKFEVWWVFFAFWDVLTTSFPVFNVLATDMPSRSHRYWLTIFSTQFFFNKLQVFVSVTFHEETLGWAWLLVSGVSPGAFYQRFHFALGYIYIAPNFDQRFTRRKL